MIVRFLLAASATLFLASAGAFFLLVPLLSLATVVCMLGGLILMFGLGMQFGTPTLASDRAQSHDGMRLLPARLSASVHALTVRIKGLFSN
jgi:hypothetical protein